MFALPGRRLAVHAGAALFAAVLAAAPAMAEDAPAPDPNKVVATVNGQNITEAEVALAEEELDPQLGELPPDQRRANALSALIDIRLMAAEEEKTGIADTDDFKRRMDFLRLRALHSEFVGNKVAKAVTEADVRARYDKEIAAAPPVNEVRASHILVKTEDEAKAIIAELEKGGDFEAIAKEKSQDPGSGASGGDLGFFGPGRMVPEFEQAAMALEVGQYTKEPVKSQFGWHVIKVTDKRPQQPPAYEQVRGEIRSIMLREKYFAEVAALRKGADVKIEDPALASAVDAVDKREEPAQ
ncbi:MAG: peptidylprolyl isomerase [Rhizobiales bacterium]|jgi:peptidyl-prolyl cis-trans isomerase C|nr:peptidylprolyl isomerase [Hyphomicrobiales bacterium]